MENLINFIMYNKEDLKRLEDEVLSLNKNFEEGRMCNFEKRKDNYLIWLSVFSDDCSNKLNSLGLFNNEVEIKVNLGGSSIFIGGEILIDKYKIVFSSNSTGIGLFIEDDDVVCSFKFK